MRIKRREFIGGLGAGIALRGVFGRTGTTDVPSVGNGNGQDARCPSGECYPGWNLGDRVVMLGNLPEVRRQHYADRPFMKDILPVQGHSVFKVAPGGRTFDAFVLTDTDESMRILYARRFTSGANAQVKI